MAETLKRIKETDGENEAWLIEAKRLFHAGDSAARLSPELLRQYSAKLSGRVTQQCAQRRWLAVPKLLFAAIAIVLLPLAWAAIVHVAPLIWSPTNTTTARAKKPAQQRSNPHHTDAAATEPAAINPEILSPNTAAERLPVAAKIFHQSTNAALHKKAKSRIELPPTTLKHEPVELTPVTQPLPQERASKSERPWVNTFVVAQENTSQASQEPTPLVQETEFIAMVLKTSEPKQALKMLQSYEQKFPNGVLATEAFLARVDLLLKLRDHPALLALLNTRTDFAELPRGQQIQLLYAELLSQESNCAAALPHFEQLFRQAADPDLRQNVLRGRALCKAETNDKHGTQEDLRIYLDQFPQGPHADEVKKALGL